MSTLLVIPQSSDIFTTNDYDEEEATASSPHRHDSEEEEDVNADDDAMDTTTSSRSSSRPSSPIVQEEAEIDCENKSNENNNENDTQQATHLDDAVFDRMLDEDLKQLEAEEEEEAKAKESAMDEEKDESYHTNGRTLEPIEQVSYGGISNLMNTCYMASALQMLGSLESFVRIVRQQVPKEESPLRTALLDLWDRVARGETVRPEEVKRLIDERSCLFEGYDQQDSHEFLTTLLDLLDEDYKGKDNYDSVSALDADTGVLDTPTKSSPADDEAQMEIDEDDTPSCKRIKTCPQEEIAEEDDVPALETESASTNKAADTSSSYSELDMNQIEALLHGNMPSSREGMIMPSPHASMSCRLVGGRMNPAENSPLWSPRQTPTTVETSHSINRDETARSAEQHSNTNAAQATTAVTPNPDTETKPVVQTSPIDDCFATKVRVRLTCDSCKYTRTQEETYLHWSLEMSDDSTGVDECLRRFFAPEKREVKCEKCFGEYATQTSHITQLPKMLLLHFKRFVVKVSDDFSSISYEKNSSSVDFEPVLSPHDDLEDYTAVDCPLIPDSRYQLRSVVNHHGSSVSFGHYTADAKRTVNPDGTLEWHRFNDSFVSKISEQQAVQESSRSAYLVMYELE